MKKLCVIILLFLLFLSGCGNSVYDEGYRDGYATARAELEDEIEWLLEDKYYEGYSDGYSKIIESRSAAESFACARSIYSPEEAQMIIDAYENNEPFWHDGSPPTEQDYMDAARTLYYFYEYYLSGEFSNFRYP